MLLASAPRNGSRFFLPLARCSSSSPSTPSLKLVAELRKRTTATIQKAREALIASSGDVDGALEWLERDRIATGDKKAQKVGSRFAGEGLIGLTVLSRGTSAGPNALGVRAAMVELNCETDFVGRNELFRKLTQDLAFTTAFMAESPELLSPTYDSESFIRSIELEHLQNAPLVLREGSETPKTVSEAIRDLITAVGENIVIRRAAAFVHNPIPPASGLGLCAAGYMHGALPSTSEKGPAILETQGKIGTLVALGLRTSPTSRLKELLNDATFDKRLITLERGLARQVAGMHPKTVRGEEALYKQPFDMLATAGGETVETVLNKWAEEHKMVDSSSDNDETAGVSVVEFLRWEAGEGLDAT